MANPYLKQITLPSGSVYDLWDIDAHTEIESIKASISGGLSWIGVTTTPLTDGSTTNPITVNGESHVAKTGDIAQYNSDEFAWNGTAWQKFGPAGTFGALAFKSNATASYTPAGSVSQPSFTGVTTTLAVSVTPTGSVSIGTGAGAANYTPAGTVSKPTFSGSASTFTATYTPAGSITGGTFTGSATTFSANYTPAGTVSKPTVTVTPNTTTINSITNVGSLPSLSFTVANENLTIAWNAGTLPTKGSNQTVVTGIASASATQPTFSGSAATIKTTGTPNGSISNLGFSGTEATIKASGTPNGSVSQPTFSGTGANIVGTFTGSASQGSVEYTPSGVVSQPSFTGTNATITVS